MKKKYIILSIVMISTLLVAGCGKVKPTTINSTNNKAISSNEEVTESKINLAEDIAPSVTEIEIINNNDDSDNFNASLNNETSSNNENTQTSSQINTDSQQALEDLSNILDDLDNALDDIDDSNETESLINNSLN